MRGRRAHQRTRSGRSRRADHEGCVTLGIGAPAVAVTWFSDCNCDACDSSSPDAIAELDDDIGAFVDGSFRHLWSSTRTVTVTGGGTRGAAGVRGHGVTAILPDPAGWQEISGSPLVDRRRDQG